MVTHTADEIVALDLTADEWRLLRCGLTEWWGPARCSDELAVAMGFGGYEDFHDEIRQRLLPLLRAEGRLTRLDWLRTLLATEIVFASGLVGSGSDWPITVGVSDEDTIRMLRGLQRKIKREVWGLLEAVGTRPPWTRGPSRAEPAAVPRVEACLAHAVLGRADDWLGLSSPTALRVFLAGAELRAAATQPTLPSWRIHGPLQDPDFDKPLLARTGHSSLSIGWATALELLHFSMTDALSELRSLIEDWFDRGRLKQEPVGSLALGDPAAFWRGVATRPAMYCGGDSGWHLSWYLAGMTKGGDWLGLPEFPAAGEIADAIHAASKKSHGSRFGGFRVHSGRGSAQALLAWAGIEPIGDPEEAS